MTTVPVSTWWATEHASLCEIAGDGSEAWADAGPPFSDHLLQLLAEVEHAFTRTGADTPGWEDPHLAPDGELRDSREEEYSRCLDPGKYRILWTRAEAWVQVLTARGWAVRSDVETGDLRSGLRWAVPPRLRLHRTTVLHPRRPGALVLILARTAADDATVGADVDLARTDAALPGLVLGVGEPALEVEPFPDCGCDACDSGSRDLLEHLDRTILSIVDGSFETQLSPGWTSRRTSFGASGGSGEEGTDLSLTLTAQPWADGWVPRPLSPAIDQDDSAWAEEMLREGRGATAWFDRLRSGRSGVATTYFRLPQVEQEITVPLDALEHPPAGYRRDHRSAVVTGMDFERAASALRSWAMHRRAGLQVSAAHTPLREGTEVRLGVGLGPLRITAPCRVAWVIEEPDRAGFAYATLPGHPESGIEQFTLTRTATGLVRFHLDVVSKPAAWYARLGAPITRRVQEIVTRRYLRALSAPPPR